MAKTDITDTVRDARSTRPDAKTARKEAKIAGIEAVKAVGKQSPILLPLLAALCYGLGRLVVDGFYTRLNTTAEAAGVGYLSIIEPAAVLAAVLAVIGTVIAMIFDAIQVFYVWLTSNLWTIVRVLAPVIALGIAVVLFLLKRDVFIKFVLPALTVVALRSLLDAFGRRKDKEAGEARAEIRHEMSPQPEARPEAQAEAQPIPWPRVCAVGLSLIVLVALCFSAHEWGVHEAGNVEKGKSVDTRIAGLDISIIGAAPVKIQVLSVWPAIKQLAIDSCLLQIGSGPNNVLLYDPANHTTLSVPSFRVVVISPSAPCSS